MLNDAEIKEVTDAVTHKVGACTMWSMDDVMDALTHKENEKAIRENQELTEEQSKVLSRLTEIKMQLVKYERRYRELVKRLKERDNVQKKEARRLAKELDIENWVDSSGKFLSPKKALKKNGYESIVKIREVVEKYNNHLVTRMEEIQREYALSNEDEKLMEEYNRLAREHNNLAIRARKFINL